MDELTVISADADEIVAVSRDGQRFRLAVDNSLRNQIAQKAAGEATPSVSPKEIQTLLRSGLSVAEVAVRTGNEIDHIARFEAPIAAELAFVLERALSVPVVAGDEETTFGAAITQRLLEQGGSLETWQAYRLNDEWVVGARCLVGSVEEDATWAFDPRKFTLIPSNAVAVRISRAETVDAVLFPPLRVVNDVPAARFDSGEFEPIRVPSATITPEVNETPVEEKLTETTSATEELLDDLAKRRGARQDAMSTHPSTGSIPVITPEMLDLPVVAPAVSEPEPLPTPESVTPESLPEGNPEAFIESTPSRSRRQRAAMPTWDEIVFGTRPDDD